MSDDDDNGATEAVLGEGQVIDNYETILAEIDALCVAQENACDVDQEGADKPAPPALEYILVKPYAVFRIPLLGIGITYNSFGHAAIRYTLPDGTQKVMNISGHGHDSMVNFHDPVEYMFGTRCDQGGVYNREMTGLRVEKLPDDVLYKLDAFYSQLQRDNQEGRKRFHILLGPVFSLFKALIPGISQRGNCAYWTSSGLVAAGLMKTPTMWPKAIFIDLFENCGESAVGGESNMNVVTYLRARHAKRRYGVDAYPIDGVAPLQSLRTLAYMNLDRFARVSVSIEGSRAVCESRLAYDHPSKLRNIVNSNSFIGASVVGSLLILRRLMRRL